MVVHLGRVMDPRLQVFMPILEGCATLEDTDTHLLTCVVGEIHLHETPPFFWKGHQFAFSKYRE